jgi:shikimate kinase
LSASERNIVLIGFMGTGKSTVGQALAERLGWRFVDTDQLVMEREGRTIAELFASEGEDYFREKESDSLLEVLRGEKQVVSTGGGSVLKEMNRTVMLSGGFVVALTAPPGVLLARLRGDVNRPLLAGDKEERVHRLLEERKHAYDFAHYTVDTSKSNVRETVESIMEMANRHRG